ncbi:MAG: LytTR family DNA-binding domain-containing protein [Lachnospiraceae bacterium]|nr:LytTR family DNA-binding domain-containing protein [Lachnospiraceae bacterium]
MKIAVCDDEKEFIDAVCPLLEDWAQQHNIRLTLCRFTDGDDLIAAHRNECMDLIILDVIMPLLSGIDAAKEIREDDSAVPIIFLTSSREFAVDSYDVKAFHYLMKPIVREKFFPVMDDFLKIFNSQKITFTAHTASGFCKIAIDDIDYLEAQDKQVLVHMADGRTIEIREQLSACESVFLPDNGFFRCHRSYIVNLKRVEQFTKKEIRMSQNATIPIPRGGYMAFKEAYFNHMFG